MSIQNTFNLPADEAAWRLLGCELVRELDGRTLRGKIVETEAYDQSDVASHSYRGKTARTEVMFGPAGYAYVYFTYGMHYCMNMVVGSRGHGSAVLIRALEPLEGVDIMTKNRRGQPMINLLNGPAKLCQAFKIDRSLNGHDLSCPPLRLIIRPKIKKEEVVQTTRIGISQGKNVPWRFYINENKFTSKL